MMKPVKKCKNRFGRLVAAALALVLMLGINWVAPQGVEAAQYNMNIMRPFDYDCDLVVPHKPPVKK